MITGKFPSLRLRRSRKNDWSRRLIEENNLTPNDFILPIFIIEGKNKKIPVKSMPGVYRYTLDKLVYLVHKAIKDGSKFDIWTSTLIVISYALPGFLVAIFLIIFFDYFED